MKIITTKLFENVQSWLKSGDNSDAEIAANAYFNEFGPFEVAKDLEAMEDIIFNDDFEEKKFEAFLAEYAKLILEARGAKDNKGE